MYRSDYLSLVDLKSMDINELIDIFLEIGEKKFRANQCFESIHNKMIENIDDITVFSKELRDKLKSQYYISNLKILERFN